MDEDRVDEPEVQLDYFLTNLPKSVTLFHFSLSVKQIPNHSRSDYFSENIYSMFRNENRER